MNIVTNSLLCKLANRIRLNLITFGKARVDAEWHGTVMSPVYSRLYYITEGDFSITLKNGEKLSLSEGKWYLIPAGISFDFECGSEMDHYYFHLKLCDFDGTDLLRKCKKPLCLNTDICSSETLKECISICDTTHALLLGQTALSVLVLFLEKYNIDIKNENYSACTMKAIKYIKENLSVQLTISEISQNIFVSKSTLTKHFKNELSMSVGEYIYDLVMSSAEYMLTTSDESIQAIGEKFGFYDQFYFSKRFKEKFGQSPRTYRKYKLW